MKHSLFLLLPILAACTFFGAREYEPNPDPNHIHADFALWIEGLKIDFSEPKYLSSEEDYHHKYLHLHDEVGHVLHRHKPGLTIKEFFKSLGFEMTANCMKLDTRVHVCPESGKTWKMFVSNPATGVEWKEVPYDPDSVFEDMDQMLLTYQGTDAVSALNIEKQQQKMTDDSCLYSQTCPWRGEPPAEDCIADPDIPCLQPQE